MPGNRSRNVPVQSLAHTTPACALTGDLVAANTTEHVDRAFGKACVRFWRIWGRCFKGVLLIKRNEVTGLVELGTCRVQGVRARCALHLGVFR